MREQLSHYSKFLIWKSVKSSYVQLPQIFWCMKNVYCDWCGEEMGYEKTPRSKITISSFAHKYFGKTSTRKLFICESKPSKPIYQILICENNLACSEITRNISPNHPVSKKCLIHPCGFRPYCFICERKSFFS